ncbi:MAG: hypothetical protein JNM50_03570 [Chromatiales bacterium]|nr:hypothetical protein [Chromatiales bacterium]
MANFLDVARDLLSTNSIDAVSKALFEKVFNAIGGLQVVHSKSQLDLNNIEAIFTALELGRIIQSVPGTDEADIPHVIAALKEVIVKTLEATLRFPVRDRWIGVPTPYQAFAELIAYLRDAAHPTQTTSVITFNYDIAVDMALYRGNLGPNYVIEAAPGPSVGVDLLKLHGSLNWASEKGTRRIRPLHLDYYFRKYSLSHVQSPREVSVPIGTQLQEYFSRHATIPIDVDAEPVIVPPSWNKADYHQALSDVWAAAARHLSQAEHVFVIGYSLPETDSFFRHLFALGSVGKAALRKLIVCNPDESVDGRFRALLGPGALARYEFWRVNFEQAIGGIRGQFPGRK